MNTAIVPNERPLSRGAYDYCNGPILYGSTQVQRYVDRWVAWIGTNGIRYGKLSAINGLGDAEGTANELFTLGERPSKIAFCFDQNAIAVIATQKDATTVELRKKVSGVVTAYLWTGNSPQVFYNGLVVATTGSTDVVCFYIKPDGTAVFARFQRDNFAIEYTLNATLNVTLARLLKVDWLHIDGSDYCVLFAEDTQGRQVLYFSKPFAPFPVFVSDKATASIGFQSGVLMPIIVIVTQALEKGKLAAAFQSGNYVLVIQAVTQPLEKGTESMAFSTGAYVLVIQVATQPLEKGTLTLTTQSGAHTSVVVSGGTFAEKNTLSVGFQSGIYS